MGRAWWVISIISATREVELRRISLQGQHAKNYQDPLTNKPGPVAHV
jgi:hypothetical protein